jgi:hypothetical protein
MKRRILEARSRRWWIVSIAAHVVIVALLTQIMFTYPLGQLLGITRSAVPQEKLHYLTLPKPTETSGGAKTAPSRGSTPSALPKPTTTPTTLPPITPLDTARAMAAGGTGTGLDPYGSGFTVAEYVDSMVRLAIGIVNDSMEIAAGQRKPGDWTVKGKDGSVWGWDQKGIRLGKYTIPQALLALLPLNVGANQDPIEARRAAWIRNDIMASAQRQISEDEFRAAVKRIRERKDRERREKLDGKPIAP